MGQPDFYNFQDFQSSVTRTSDGRVEFDVGAQSVGYLSTPGAPWFAITLEAVSTSAGWSIDRANQSPDQSSSWETVESGSLNAGQKETIFVGRVDAQYLSVNLDGDGHKVWVHQTALPLKSEVKEEAKALTAIQSPAPDSQTAEPIQPATNGATTPCDILIVNVGQYEFWVSDGASTTGLLLKPGDHSEDLLYHHTAEDGDLTLYPDTSDGMSAMVLIRS